MTWVRRVCLVALVGVVVGAILAAVSDGRGPALVAGAMMCCIGGGVGLGFVINLVWWNRIARVLRVDPWQRSTVLLRMTPAWWSRNQYDVLFDDHTTAIAADVVFAGDAGPLQHYRGFDTDPQPGAALVAGTGRFRVLTTETGDLLLPLKLPRSSRQAQRWRHRWRDHLLKTDAGFGDSAARK